MGRQVAVMVHWTARQNVARLTGTRYHGVSRFPQNWDSWRRGAWSIILDFADSPAVQGNPSKGVARFLVDEAPQDWLRSGTRFELHTGAKDAEVEVL
jgi:hypothetical protein